MRLWIAMIIVALAAPVLAQDSTRQPADCPTIVRTAITLANERCEATGENQICYGHLVLDAQPRAGLTPFGFDTPGDIVDVVAVQSMRLSALDTTTGQWGVVMMQLEASLVNAPVADTKLKILLFGDAELNDATRFLPGRTRQSADIRQEPTANSRVITTLEPASEITANGRLPDSTWLRINLRNRAGWIQADTVHIEGDWDSLAVIDSASTPNEDARVRFGPMQAFYFRSGINDAPCAEAPNSGLLIQTPEGVASVSIWLDEVVIQLDATAFIQADAGGNLTINILDGSAQVTAQGETRAAAAGTQISVPLDNQLAARTVPQEPVPFAPQSIQALPIELLDRPIDIPNPLETSSNVPFSGLWQFAWDTAQLTCPDGTIVPFESTGVPGPIQVGSESLTWNATTYALSTPGIYRSSYVDSSGNLHQDTLQVIARDMITGEKTLDLVSPVCTLNVGFQLRFVGSAE
jgi:hypothetical protein